MKKHVLIALMACTAVLAVGCSKKKETEKVTEKAQASVETEASTDLTGSEDAAPEGMSEEAEEAAEEAIAEEEKVRPTYKALDYVTVGEYKNLPVTVEEPGEVTEEQIDERITEEIKAASKYDKLEEGTVQVGDIANIDYEGKKDDVAFEGGTAKGYDLEIGSGSFIDGFEDGLVGVAVGETVDLNLTFPEQYHSAELAGAEVVFTVTVNSIQRMPAEITDELVSDLSGGSSKTVADYRASLKETIAAEAEELRENKILNELMTQLYNTCTIKEYPQDVVDYSINEMTDYYKAYADSMGMEWADFLQQYLQVDEETFKMQADYTVKASLQQELILMAIAETEGLDQLTDQEYEEACQKYMENLGYATIEEFKAAYPEDRIRASIIMDKSMELVRENALLLTEEDIEALSEGDEEMTEQAGNE